MTKQKDLKRRVRARMNKTGESYTAARRNVVAKKDVPVDYAALAGMSDAAVEKKTGKNWRQWTADLDAKNVIGMSHREIAALVLERWPEIGGWWAQSVTVAYERIRGVRDIGQPCDSKTYNASKSRTFGVPIAKLYRAWSVKRTRSRWIGEHEPRIRTSTVEKSMRLTWPDGTAVDVYFTDKAPQKSSVAVQHRKLPSKAAAEQAKVDWAARFDALAELLR